jgi:hypothetical protein
MVQRLVVFVSAGSRKLFAALLDRCIARKVVPICCFTPRRNAAPSVVALIPQEERLDDSNLQILPPGFHVTYLPYSGKQLAIILCVLFHCKIYAGTFQFCDIKASGMYGE